MTEFMATAAPRSLRLTSAGTMACIAGVANAVVKPSSSAMPITRGTVPHPIAMNAASVAQTVAAPICVATRSLRRSKRSAAAPAHGASKTTPMNIAKFVTPTRSVDCVRR